MKRAGILILVMMLAGIGSGAGAMGIASKFKAKISFLVIDEANRRTVE